MSIALARTSGITLSLVLSLSTSTAWAAQFVALDDTWIHTPDLADSHYRASPAAATPADWTSPVDYSQGTAWVYLEVQTKPSAQPTKFQLCFEATPTYACTNQSPTYTATGTYEWSTPFADFWSPPSTSVDWTLGVNKLACILKDTMNGKPSSDNVGPTTAALYTPTQVRMVVTIVAPGSTYVSPTPTGTGGAGGASASQGSTAAVTVGVSTSSGAGGAPGGSGSGGAGGSSSSGKTSDGGCAVGAPSRGEGGFIVLAFGALAAARLRRRR